MTSDRAPRRIHVERTADPAVLRWVVHHPRLDAAPTGRRLVPDRSALGELVANGSIVSVSVRHGAVLVTGSDPAMWKALAPMVQAAVLRELDEIDRTTTHWLVEAIHPDPGPPASIAELQYVVDRAAGTVLAGHGGAMSVVAFDGNTVRLRSAGACTGCNQSNDTVVGLISPALRAEFPEVTSVVVEPDPEQPPPSRFWPGHRSPPARERH